MSPDLYTFIAHRGLPFANPLSEEIVGRALQLLALRQTDRVVDFGSGFCELPIRIVETYGAICDAVELSPRIAAAARVRIGHRLGERGLADQLRLHEGDAGAFRAQLTPGEFACSVCIGSTHAIGGFDNACRVLSRLSRAAGLCCWVRGIGAQTRPASSSKRQGFPLTNSRRCPAFSRLRRRTGCTRCGSGPRRKRTGTSMSGPTPAPSRPSPRTTPTTRMPRRCWRAAVTGGTAT